MKPALTRTALCALFLITAFAAADDIAIPTYLRDYGDVVVGASSAEPAQVANRATYAPLVELPMSSNVFDAWFDHDADVTNVHVGNYPAGCVTMHTIAPDLTAIVTNLPIAYGMAWVTVDLDQDGQVELILQRGDTGMGGNGYLDIHSAPDWQQRAHFVLAGMKVYCYPTAVNVDADPHLELFLTPSSLGGSARAMLIDYDAVSGEFVLTDDLVASYSTGGATAACDFDADGEVELICGHSSGYDLYEYTASGLQFVGPLPGALAGSWAIAVQPFADGRPHLLLGHSSFSNGYRYELLRATGDNVFQSVHLFQEITGWAGAHPSAALDADLDGLDEIVMNFYPYCRVIGWDEHLQSFTEDWAWDQPGETGTFVHYGAGDLDRDQVPEWFCGNHNNLFRAYEDQDVQLSAVEPSPSRGPLVACSRAYGTAVEISMTIPPHLSGQTGGLALYSAAGRLLGRPLGGSLTAGRHTVRWCAPGSGPVYYRANSGTETRTGHFLVVR